VGNFRFFRKSFLGKNLGKGIFEAVKGVKNTKWDTLKTEGTGF